MAEAMRATVSTILRGIERYNPENISILEHYVDLQCKENTYDLEANLALLKLYQFQNGSYRSSVACQILLKALTNLPHTDYVLCKCLLGHVQMNEKDVEEIMLLHDLLEMCRFEKFWIEIKKKHDRVGGIKDFNDSIRKYICHVIGITYQRIEKKTFASLLGNVDEATMYAWMNKYGWSEVEDDYIFVANQEETVKTKNITEQIEFDSVAAIMATCR